MSPLFVGVDGGGTRTRAVAVDTEGRELGRSEGPPSLIDPLEPARAADAVEETVRALLSRVAPGAGAGPEGDPMPPSEALWAGLAGAGREASRSAVEAELGRRRLARRVGVGTDVEAAVEAAFPDGAGILLVSGTGSVAAARDGDGGIRRVGGWGALLGDEGSGYAVGLRGLRAAMRMIDGRERATELLPALLEWSGVDAPDDVPAWVAGASKAEVAALAATVVAAADSGDPVAGRILADAVEALVDHVVALADAHHEAGGAGPGAAVHAGFVVALAGGMIEPGAGLLRSRLVSALEEHGFRVTSEPVDAARGSATRALRL